LDIFRAISSENPVTISAFSQQFPPSTLPYVL
jgi:hypothetical protein